MAGLRVHCPTGVPAVIDGDPQRLKNCSSFKYHSGVECHPIKVLFNIYQTCAGVGLGARGVMLWGNRNKCSRV